MDGINRKAIEDFLLDIACLDEISKKVSKFNPFETLGLVNNEIKHSNVLAWLFDPNENHGFDEIVIKKFVQHIAKKYPEYHDVIKLSLMDLSDIYVRREWKHIDLIAVSEKNRFVLVIENKIWSKESKHQLSDYKRKVINEYDGYDDIIYVFLTPEGLQSSDPDVWLSMNYSEIIEVILESMNLKIDEISNDVKAFINQYIIILRRYIVGQSDLEKICKEIYYKHKKALDLIYEFRPDQYSEVNRILLEIIREDDRLIEEQSSKTLIRFVPKTLEKINPRSCERWTDSKRLLILEIPNGESLRLKLVVGPTVNDERDTFIDYAKSKPQIFKGASKRKSVKWSVIYSKDLMKKNYIDDYENDYDSLKADLKLKLNALLENDIQKIIDSFIKEFNV